MKSIAVAASFVGAFVFLVAPPASADDYGLCNSNTGCRPDNHDHEYCRVGSWDGRIPLWNLFNENMNDLGEESNFTPDYHYQCQSGTDVLTIVSEQSSGNDGVYRCIDKNWRADCDKAEIILYARNLTDDRDRRQTSCHEIGHSGGLTHHSAPYDDCMISSSNLELKHTQYNSHHETHLNNLD